MRILILAHFAGSPHHGMVYGHYYLARDWVRLGHEVAIVAAGFAHTRHRQPALTGPVTEEWIDGIRYLWVRTPEYVPADRLGRVRSMLAFVAQIGLRRLPVECADLVICSSHYPFAIHPARRFAQRCGARLVFEVRDLWPLTLIELGGARAGNPFIRAMQWSEDYAYRTADRVVSVLANSASYMEAHGMDPAKFLFVPNGVDLTAALSDQPLPLVHRQVLDGLRATGRFMVGYAGRVGLANALHTLIDGAGLDPAVQVVILGDGSHVPTLQAQAQRLGIAERVTFLPSVDKAQVNDFLGRMDAVYIGLQHQPLFRFGVSPTKLNDYMLAAKPIISAIDAPGDIVAESGAGISCAAEDPAAIAAAIGRLRALSAAELGLLGQRGLAWIRANRDYQVLARRFLDGVMRESPAAMGPA